MKADTGKHSHCFCTGNATGHTVCCYCEKVLTPALRVTQATGKVLTWLDHHWLFVNEASKGRRE